MHSGSTMTPDDPSVATTVGIAALVLEGRPLWEDQFEQDTETSSSTSPSPSLLAAALTAAEAVAEAASALGNAGSSSGSNPIGGGGVTTPLQIDTTITAVAVLAAVAAVAHSTPVSSRLLPSPVPSCSSVGSASSLSASSSASASASSSSSGAINRLPLPSGSSSSSSSSAALRGSRPTTPASHGSGSSAATTRSYPKALCDETVQHIHRLRQKLMLIRSAPGTSRDAVEQAIAVSDGCAGRSSTGGGGAARFSGAAVAIDSDDEVDDGYGYRFLATSSSAATPTPASQHGRAAPGFLSSLQSLATNTCLNTTPRSMHRAPGLLQTVEMWSPADCSPPAASRAISPQAVARLASSAAAAAAAETQSPSATVATANAAGAAVPTTPSTPSTATTTMTTPTTKKKMGPHCEEFLKKIGLIKCPSSSASTATPQQLRPLASTPASTPRSSHPRVVVASLPTTPSTAAAAAGVPYVEGHHCQPLDASCTRWRTEHCKLLHLIKQSEAICIEVYLGPERHAILLEQWTIQLCDRKPNQMLMTLPSLCSAIRSQLYFSQISAWTEQLRTAAAANGPSSATNASPPPPSSSPPDAASNPRLLPVAGVAGGRWRLDVYYRVRGVVDQPAVAASFNAQPNVHQFPDAAVSEQRCVRVCLRSLPRLDAIPTLQLRVSTPAVAEAVAAQQLRQRAHEPVASTSSAVPHQCTETGKHQCHNASNSVSGSSSSSSNSSPDAPEPQAHENAQLAHRNRQLQRYRKRLLRRDQKKKPTPIGLAVSSSSFDDPSQQTATVCETVGMMIEVHCGGDDDDKATTQPINAPAQISINSIRPPLYGSAVQQQLDAASGLAATTTTTTTTMAYSSSSSASTSEVGATTAHVVYAAPPPLAGRSIGTQTAALPLEQPSNAAAAAAAAAYPNCDLCGIEMQFVCWNCDRTLFERWSSRPASPPSNQPATATTVATAAEAATGSERLIQSIQRTPSFKQLQLTRQRMQQEIGDATGPTNNGCPGQQTTTTTTTTMMPTTTKTTCDRQQSNNASRSDATGDCGMCKRQKIAHNYTAANGSSSSFDSGNDSYDQHPTHQQQHRQHDQQHHHHHHNHHHHHHHQHRRSDSNSSNIANNNAPMVVVVCDSSELDNNNSCGTRDNNRHAAHTARHRMDTEGDGEEDGDGDGETDDPEESMPYVGIGDGGVAGGRSISSNISSLASASSYNSSVDEAMSMSMATCSAAGAALLEAGGGFHRRSMSESLDAAPSCAIRIDGPSGAAAADGGSTHNNGDIDMRLYRRAFSEDVLAAGVVGVDGVHNDDDDDDNEAFASTACNDALRSTRAHTNTQPQPASLFKTPTAPGRSPQLLSHPLHISTTFRELAAPPCSPSTSMSAMSLHSPAAAADAAVVFLQPLPSIHSSARQNLNKIFCISPLETDSTIGAAGTASAEPSCFSFEAATRPTTIAPVRQRCSTMDSSEYAAEHGPSGAATVHKSYSAPSFAGIAAAAAAAQLNNYAIGGGEGDSSAMESATMAHQLLSPRFLKMAAIQKRRSRHLSDRSSERSSIGSDDPMSDDEPSGSSSSSGNCAGAYTVMLQPHRVVRGVARKPLPKSYPFGRRALLGSIEESLLQRCFVPTFHVPGFKVLLGASGGFCPTQLTIPSSTSFYELHGECLSTPYMCEIRMPRKGYSVPRKGTVQATLLNPLGLVVRMFVVPYDLRDMPVMHQTFVRQRVLAFDGRLAACADGSAAGACGLTNSEQMPLLRYAIHLRFQTSRSGRLALHTDIRMVIARRTDCDTAAAHAKGQLETPNELRVLVVAPEAPKYSPRLDGSRL